MIITQTPLRLSFCGGGTDLPSFYEQEQGAVISTAIDKYIYVIVKERFDNNIRVGYTKTEIVSDVNDLQHELIREALKSTDLTNSIEVVTISDIPAEGSGLGSSSTLTVGLLNAFYQYISYPQHPGSLAEQACHIEIWRLNHPIGKQDQYIAAVGGFRKFVFNFDGAVGSWEIFIKPAKRQQLNNNLMLFYTGITRKADTILSEQTNRTAQNMPFLRAMRAMVDELENELMKGNIDAVGDILHRGWQYKKQLASGISNSEIDNIYNNAIQAGATGGKITGAGGGGFLLLYVPIDQQVSVRQALSELREVPFRMVQDGTKTLLNVRRG